MNKNTMIMALACLLTLAGCKEKKQTQDIIAPRIEVAKPSGPIRMQPYNDQRDVKWLGKTYKVEVNRLPNDSLPMVTDETGQKFVDNRISLVVRRADGSVAIQKTFTKAAFDGYIDAATFEMLDVRGKGVTADIYSDSEHKSLRDMHNTTKGVQPVNTHKWSTPSHDRWLIIDDKVYHFGASLKDLRKKWFGVSLYQDITPEELLSKIS